MCLEGRNLHVVPVQTRVTQVRLAVQKGRRALHSVTEVVVVITECDCMLMNYISEQKIIKTYIFYYNGTVYSTFSYRVCSCSHVCLTLLFYSIQ